MEPNSDALFQAAAPILKCNACGSASIELGPDRNHMLCGVCRRRYPIVDGILDLVSDQSEGGTWETYGNASFIYDFWVPRIGMPLFGYGIGDVKSLTSEGLDQDKGGWILDAPSGTGFFTLELLRRRPNRRVVCLDLSLEMLGRARKRVEKYGLGNRVVLIHGDALKMPFVSGAFETALCINGLHSIVARRAALCEFQRCLRGGGRVYGNVIVKAFGTLSKRWQSYEVRHDAFSEPFNEGEYLNLFGEVGFRVAESRMVGGSLFFVLLRQ
jgi:ubiquinone/menaquinone biosynthesis C-methylase UbiE